MLNANPLQRQRIFRAPKILAESVAEDLIVVGGVGKERHRRAEFEVVRVAEDLFDAVPLDRIYQLSALP